MSKISSDDVRKLATLSAIAITDDEIDTVRNELVEILSFVEQLNDIDTTNVEPTYQVNNPTDVMRADEIIDYGVSSTDLLRSAPHEQNQTKVPRVIE